MVIAYDDTLSKINYHEIKEISEEDREVLWSCSRTYNYVNEQPIEPVKKKQDYQENESSCWDDFNQKTDIFEIIGSDFQIVANIVFLNYFYNNFECKNRISLWILPSF